MACARPAKGYLFTPRTALERHVRCASASRLLSLPFSTSCSATSQPLSVRRLHSAELGAPLVERCVARTPPLRQISTTAMPASESCLRSTRSICSSVLNLLLPHVGHSPGWRTPATSGWYGWKGAGQGSSVILAGLGSLLVIFFLLVAASAYVFLRGSENCGVPRLYRRADACPYGRLRSKG